MIAETPQILGSFLLIIKGKNADMTENKMLTWLIDYFIQESPTYSKVEVPHAIAEKQRLFRCLLNVRPPEPIGKEFLCV